MSKLKEWLVKEHGEDLAATYERLIFGNLVFMPLTWQLWPPSETTFLHAIAWVCLHWYASIIVYCMAAIFFEELVKAPFNRFCDLARNVLRFVKGQKP